MSLARTPLHGLLRWTLALALAGLPLAAAATPTLVGGPPTYDVSHTGVIDLGDFSSPPSRTLVATRRSGYRSGGGAVRSIQDHYIGPTLTEGFGEASDTVLRSRAVASGNTGLPNPQTPTIQVTNTTSVTRFYEFRSNDPRQTSVPVDAFFRLNGSMQSFFISEGGGGNDLSQVEFRLEILSDTGALLFEALRITALTSRGGPIVVGSTDAGLSTRIQNAFVDHGPPPGRLFGRLFSITHVELFSNAYRAPVGIPLGFRWTLETTAELTGALVGGHNFADFSNTANVDFSVNPSAPYGSFREIPVLPVPEPSPHWLASAGIVGLGLFRAPAKRRRPTVR